jgi:hypothetical protein
MRDRRKRHTVMRVDDQTRDFVGLVRNDVLLQKSGQRHIGERILRGDPFLAALRRNAGKLIAAAQRRGLAEQRLEIAEHVTALSDRRMIHGDARMGRLAGRHQSATECSPA